MKNNRVCRFAPRFNKDGKIVCITLIAIENGLEFDRKDFLIPPFIYHRQSNEQIAENMIRCLKEQLSGSGVNIIE